jgi:uncharacterized protein (DUF433 family)
VSRLDRITSDPNVCHGQPTVRGLRYTVESLLELLSAGMTVDEVLADYPTWNTTTSSPHLSSVLVLQADV